MSLETYYRDHWVTIEPERLQRYSESFRINDANRPMFVDPLGAQTGEVILDFGCGPGYVSVELAKTVGADGHVHAVDLNPDLLEMAQANAADAGVADRISFHHVADASVPLDDASLDRAVFKSVLLYVPEIDATLADAHRAIRPGGYVVTQDSDMWLSACTAFTRDEWRRFQDAMVPAFKDPTMGRNLPGALRRAGFVDIDTKVSVFADDQGFFRSTLENFIGYTRETEALSEDEAAAMARRADEAIEAGDWLFVLNFFQVNGQRSPA